MNIILNSKEKHPVAEGNLDALNLSDKKVLFVYGLARSRGDNRIAFSTVGAGTGEFLNQHDTLEEYAFDGDVPEILDVASRYWTQQGFDFQSVGLSRNLRDSMTSIGYRDLLNKVYRASFGNN